MSAVRALTPGDVPAVAELLIRSGAGADAESLEARLRHAFVEHPWPHADIRSLIAEDAAGKLQAFLGVIPRPMTYAKRELRAAVATTLTIHPECREFVGMRLLKHLIAGPQDLSLMPSARCAVRSVWERLGGSAAVAYGVSWLRPLRPAAWAFGRVRSRLGPFAALGDPLARVADAALQRIAPGAFRLPRAANARDVSDDELVRWIDDVAGSRLHARYDTAALSWVLARARERAGAPVSRIVVDGTQKGTRGWCVLATPPGGVAQVLQMAVRGDAGDDVARAAFRRAYEAGCVAITGRVDPAFLIDLSDRGALMHATGTHVLVHAKDQSLMRDVERGDALLGRLDGEWLTG